MKDKGYDFPLYSLDLLVGDTVPTDDPMYRLASAQGYLVVRRGLRRLGENTATLVCERALHRALALHQLNAPLFADYGHGPKWRASVEHWRGRLAEEDRLRLMLLSEDEVLRDRHRRLVTEGRALWRRLALAARLAGLDGLVLAGETPRNELVLYEGLRQAASRARAADRGDDLSAHGFGPAHQARLQAVLADFLPQRQGAQDRAAALREQLGGLVVLRGALLGDLSRLAQVAAAVLQPELARPLQQKHLLHA